MFASHARATRIKKGGYGARPYGMRGKMPPVLGGEFPSEAVLTSTVTATAGPKTNVRHALKQPRQRE